MGTVVVEKSFRDEDNICKYVRIIIMIILILYNIIQKCYTLSLYTVALNPNFMSISFKNPYIKVSKRLLSIFLVVNSVYHVKAGQDDISEKNVPIWLHLHWNHGFQQRFFLSRKSLYLNKSWIFREKFVKKKFRIFPFFIKLCDKTQSFPKSPLENRVRRNGCDIF